MGNLEFTAVRVLVHSYGTQQRSNISASLRLSIATGMTTTGAVLIICIYLLFALQRRKV